jgi:hypothetical protein
MNKFLFPFLSLLIMNPSGLRAQEDSLFKRNIVFAEIAGGGLAYSINYEFRFQFISDNMLGIKIGSNYLGQSSNFNGDKIPFIGSLLGFTYYLKKERKYITFGASHFLLHGFHSDQYPSFTGFENYSYYNTGFAWSKHEKKTDLRVNAGAITDYKTIYPWAALSFGFKF